MSVNARAGGGIKISVIMTTFVQSKVLESKAKQVHFQQDLKSSNLTVEAWLLARKSLAGSEC